MKRFSGYKNNGKPYFRRPILIIAISVLIGTATHLFWDSFTHPGRYFVRHITILTQTVNIAGHPVPVYNLVQHTTTLIGAAVIIYAMVQLPVGKITKAYYIVFYWIKILLVTALFVSLRVMTGGLNTHLFGDVIVTAFSGLWIAVILVSAITPSKQPA